MKTYWITVKDNFFLKELVGSFNAKTKAQAIKDAKEFYAHSCGTITSEIEIISVK